jgi:hypothetical protein
MLRSILAVFKEEQELRDDRCGAAGAGGNPGTGTLPACRPEDGRAYTTSVGVPKTPSSMSRPFETRGGIDPDIGRGSSGERFEGNLFHDLLNGPLTTVDEL